MRESVTTLGSMQCLLVSRCPSLILFAEILTNETGDVREEGRAPEHHDGADPVVDGEWVGEVPNTEQQRHELAQRHHQRDGQRWALSG